MDAEISVHLYSEEWEGSAKERAENAAASQDRRGEDGVGVDQVVHNAKEDQDHSTAKGNRCGDAGGPGHIGTVGPCKPVKADR